MDVAGQGQREQKTNQTTNNKEKTKMTEKNDNRGSTEAVEKRVAARTLNTALGFGGKKNGRDGRTEKRRQRLFKELREGKKGETLKPTEILQRADELLKLGETPETIRESGVLTDGIQFPEDMSELVTRVQEVYGFDPRAWSVLGIDAGS